MSNSSTRGIGEYWISENGQCVKVEDMNEHHAKNALKKIMLLAAVGDVERMFNCIGSEEEYQEESA